MIRREHGLLLLGLLICLCLPGLGFAQGVAEPAPIIRELVFSGFVNLPPQGQQLVRGAVKSQVGQPLNEETVKQDEERIRDLGSFRFVSHAVETLADGVRLTFTVMELPVVTGIEFAGNTKFTTQQLLNQIHTRPGQVLNRNQIRDDGQAIETLYAQKGYTQTRVQDYHLSDDNKLVFIIFEPRIGEIRFAGNTKTHDYVIRRQLMFHPGDVYNVNTVSQSLKNLDNLGIFQDISAVPEPGAEPGTLIETIRVAERRTGMASVAVGESNIEGLIGILELADTNLAGTGQSLSAKMQFGADKSYELTYVNPWIDPQRTSFSLDLYNKVLLQEAIEADGSSVLYDQKRDGVTMTIGRPFGPNTHYYLSPRWDTIGATNYNNNVVPAILLQESNVHSIMLSRQDDTRDNILTPSSGSFTNLAAEFAGLGGAKFTKYTGDLRHYWNLSRRKPPATPPVPGEKQKKPLPLVFAERLVLGTTSGAPPFLEQFLIGGADSLRGYKEDQFPGQRELLWNNELRIPLAESIQAVTFIDFGDAWGGNYAAEFGDETFKLHYGYGLGIRVITPIGPLRLDYGFNGEHGHELHFGMGSTF